MRSLLACFVFVAACGARTSTPPPPRPTPAPPVAPPNPRGPSELECDELYVHVLGIAIAERQPPPSEADRAELRAELWPGFVADCRGGTRAYYACGRAATSRTALDACKLLDAK